MNIKLTFVICGAPKAGTTSLYHLLNAHPDVCMSSIKETDFFQHNFSNGYDWFYALYSHYNGEFAIGEASPGNMIHPEAPERMYDHNPDMKLIFMLREPIERAWSQFQYALYRGTEHPDTDFYHFITDPHNPFGQRTIELGMYCEQLKRYSRFFKRDQMLVLFYEDFSQNTASTLKEIFNFINVDPNFIPPHSSRENRTLYLKQKGLYRLLYSSIQPFKRMGFFSEGASAKVKSWIRDMFLHEAKPVPDKKSIEYLKKVYDTPNKQLSAFLGKDLTNWQNAWTN